MDIFKLYRNFWDFAFANPEKVKPNHIAIYSFAIEHCNRLGWKEKFGLPASMVLEATGIKSYATYKKAFDDLVEFGFLKVVEYSKNQYSSNIIALSNFDKANAKALDKALSKHMRKHFQSTCESNDSIDIQETIYNPPPPSGESEFLEIGFCSKKYFDTEKIAIEEICMAKRIKPPDLEKLLNDFNSFLRQSGTTHKIYSDYKKHFRNNLFSHKNSYKKNSNVNNSESKSGTNVTFGGFPKSEVERFFGAEIRDGTE
jgi:hypothetical protein